MTTQQARISVFIATLLGLLIAWAGTQNGQLMAGYSVFGIGVALAFLINWLAFIPAFRNQSEKFYDLTGSITYLSVVAFALVVNKDLDTRSLLLGSLVMIWALRLGTFLARRIHRDGKDRRFDEIKPNFWRFLAAWTIQALWVVLTSSAALIAITSSKKEALGWMAIMGLVIWIIGFMIEVVADYQKSQFRKIAENKGQFIQSGLWSKSRHPNYFGEIVLWIGILIIALPVFEGWQFVGIISPIFVILLLTRVSGIPMLEYRADEKWGGEEAYEQYKKNTPVLIPKL